MHVYTQCTITVVLKITMYLQWNLDYPDTLVPEAGRISEYAG